MLATCKRLRIPIIAYRSVFGFHFTSALDTDSDRPFSCHSPLGRGLLTGQVKSKSDIPEGDMRSHFDRFQDENLAHNLKVSEQAS